MNVDTFVGGALVTLSGVFLLGWGAYLLLDLIGKRTLAKREQESKTSHDHCDACRNRDPHGLQLVRVRITGRLQLVCQGCATEGAALGNYTVLERRRQGRR